MARRRAVSGSPHALPEAMSEGLYIPEESAKGSVSRAKVRSVAQRTYRDVVNFRPNVLYPCPDAVYLGVNVTHSCPDVANPFPNVVYFPLDPDRGFDLQTIVLQKDTMSERIL